MASLTISARAQAPARPRVELLAVCQNPVDRATLRSIMARANWAVHWASTLASALEFLGTNSVPVVLCCADLGDGTWRDLLRFVTEIRQVPSVVIFTEDADESLWSDILRAGAQDVLTKPFDADDLYEVVSLAYRAWSERCERSRIVLA